MYDGSVISDNNGTGIYFTGGNLTMKGSSAISRNSTGGIICLGWTGSAYIASTIIMEDDSVVGGFQQSDGNTGGGIFLSLGAHSLVMKGNAAIAFNNGGGLSASTWDTGLITITMEDSSIIRNNTGSGIFAASASITMKGYSKIGGAPGQGNTADEGGGVRLSNIYTLGAYLYVRDYAAISHNHANSKGGGVFKSTGGVTFSEGIDKVKDNTKGSARTLSDIEQFQ
jgi:hypothetical protein